MVASESIEGNDDASVVPEHEECLQQAISKLQEEIIDLRLKQKYLDAQRREALDKILDIKGSIRVFCRVKSPSLLDYKRTRSTISIDQEKVTVQSIGSKKGFAVDRVFDHESKQDDVFMEVEPIVRSALDGHNVCIFAYGQTGTGKTFTMEGTIERPGIVPRALKQIFNSASQDKASYYTFSISMLEVYMGSLRDLLAPKQDLTRNFGYNAKSGINILCNGNVDVEVEGLKDVITTDFKQAYIWYARGKRARSTSWTNVNEASSRSHCLTRITIRRTTTEKNVVFSKLWMVDLGGSERLLKTGATGRTLDEGKAINLSLSALGDVIAALRKKQNYIPYRNSKLTQILSDSLGDGSKVLMIIHVSGSESNVGETICSLSFAKRVRAVESRRDDTVDLKKQKEKLIMDLNQQVHDTEEQTELLRSEIEKARASLEEKRVILEKMFQIRDQKGSPRSPLILNQTEITESCVTTAEKANSKRFSAHLPRFMTPTVCSRQRQSSVLENQNRMQFPFMGSRNSMDLIGSQSVSRSGSQSKDKLPAHRSSISKNRNHRHLHNLDNSTDSKSSSILRDRKISSSVPNMKVTLHQYKRRMSDLN